MVAIVRIGKESAAFLQSQHATDWVEDKFPNAHISPSGAIRAKDAYDNMRIVGTVEAFPLLDMPGELLDQKPPANILR